MKTTLYLIRHGATEANLARPQILQGLKQNASLARLGVHQAQATRNLLAIRPIDACYCSPLLRAVETAQIVAAPHNIAPIPLESLIECDIGRWEGLDWQTVRRSDEATYHHFMNGPGEFGYPGGESFADVHRRVADALEDLFANHAGQAILVVGHHVVNRTYLAGLLGLPLHQARQVILDNCGISIVIRENGETSVQTLNARFHLQGIAA
jgi:broad specificity phosphatase PhoE